MSARIDVARAINRHRDAAIARLESLELKYMTDEQLEARRVELEGRKADDELRQNPAYAIGQLNAMLIEAAKSFTSAFRAGMASRGIS